MKQMDFSQLLSVQTTGQRSANIRTVAADFEVKEDLPFRPVGDGSHVWLYIEKTDTNTDWLSQQLALFAGVSPVAVGYAGIKDRHAITSQWFSVNLQGLPEPDWSAFENDNIRILQRVRHDKKLKRGVLSGNRFRLVLRELTGKRVDWETALKQISHQGVPNYFGAQRFGHGGNNLQKAEQWFATGEPPQKRNQRSMILSAARSWLFNLVLSERINLDNWNHGIPGDIMMLSGTRASYFLAETIDSTIENRLAEMDIHPSGPLWGEGDAPNQLDSLALEQRVLSDWQDWQKQLAKLDLKQERRALRVFPRDFQWQFIEDTLILSFGLPPGSYATAVLKELAVITDSHSQKLFSD